MPTFEARIQQIKVTYSPFSSAEMMTIGQVVLEHIVDRIKSVQDVTDSRAKPLKDTYMREKVRGRSVAKSFGRFKGLPVRDWTLRGRTLGACKVKYASQERVTIGPTSEETATIITARTRIDKMWGVSPSDGEALTAVIKATLLQTPAVRVERVGERKVA